jgi:hypothetical protein
MKLQIAIFKEIYNYGKESYRLRKENEAKGRLKPKRAKHTFKAGKLEE